MFLVDMIWTQTPAHWHLKIPIKWYGSIYFVSLVEKKCSSICPEKATENSIQMVNALGQRTGLSKMERRISVGIFRPKYVDKLQRWSRIFRSEETEMVLFIWIPIDCKTVVFRRFRKARNAVSVILECEAREPHTAGRVRRVRRKKWRIFSVSRHSPSPRRFNTTVLHSRIFQLKFPESLA